MGHKWKTGVNSCGPRHPEWERETSVNSCGPRNPEWETRGRQVGDKCKLMRPKEPRVGDKCGKQVWETSVGDKCGKQVWDTSVNSCAPRHPEWDTGVGDEWETSVKSCGPRHPEWETSGRQV